MPIEFAAAHPPDPRLPARRRLRPRRRRRDAGLERVVLRAAAGGGAGRGPRARRRQPLSGSRPTRRCVARSRTATGSRRSGSRSATGRATSCSPPARRCSSRAPRSSTPGRRSASIRTSPPPRARARSRCRSTTRTATTSTRSPPRSPWRRGWCMVCNPNNPTSTAVGARRDRGVHAAVPGHVCVILDEAYCEFALDPRRHVRLARAAAQVPEPGAAADVLEGLRAGRRCGSATRCAAPRTSASRSTRSASRST